MKGKFILLFLLLLPTSFALESKYQIYSSFTTHPSFLCPEDALRCEIYKEIDERNKDIYIFIKSCSPGTQCNFENDIGGSLGFRLLPGDVCFAAALFKGYKIIQIRDTTIETTITTKTQISTTTSTITNCLDNSEICTNGVDDDCDGKTDCYDYECSSNPTSGCCPVGDLCILGCPEYCSCCNGSCFPKGHVCESPEPTRICVNSFRGFCIRYDYITSPIITTTTLRSCYPSESSCYSDSDCCSGKCIQKTLCLSPTILGFCMFNWVVKTCV